MNRTLYKTLIALLWLAPLAIAIRYWQVWDQLPVRMASHFDAAGRANGWMTRETSLIFTVGFLAFLAAAFSIGLFVVQKKYELTRFAWALLAFFHLLLWTVVYSLNITLNYNLDGSPIAIAPLLIVGPLGLIAIVALALADKRGPALSDAPDFALANFDVLAEEVHSGKEWALLCLVPLVPMAVTFFTVSNLAAKISVGLLAVFIVAVSAAAWDGFHYYFSRHGVEIRTLGFRLKSIPFLQIKDYEIARWNLARGYGIRGVGNRKAYVWGNSGVRVHTYDGEIFLGHSDPQRIVHDLNMIKSHQHS
jgi:hypothetical protein